MNLNKQINNVCKLSYFQLTKIRQIRKYISDSVAKKLIHAFISSSLDYCNSLYYGLPKYMIAKLQGVQNAAARLVTSVSKYEHITPSLRELHWLPVSFRVNFKIAILVFKCLNNMAPLYLSNLIQIRNIDCRLRSGDRLAP